MKTCNKPSCNFKHHAKGLCKRHYNQLNRLQELLEAEEPKPAKLEPEPQHVERRKSRIDYNGKNFNYLLNKKFLEKIFVEAAKASNDTLYKVTNGAQLQELLTLALKMSGYEGQSAAVFNEILTDLRTWAGARDRLRFLEVCENWTEYAEKYSHLDKPKQLTLFK